MRAITFNGAGGNEVVALETRPEPTPTGDDVLVAVRYAGLNPADLAQRAGRYPAPPGVPDDVAGIEVSGTVVAVGPTARRFSVGERVFGIVGGGGLASRVLVHESHVTAVPETLDELEAAAIPEVFVTAHDAVWTQAELRMGGLLLVNGANGGVGTAAIQLAVACGARVLATVRSEATRDAVAALGATVVPREEAVSLARSSGGADVVLELVGGANLSDDLDALRETGRVVIVGTGAGAEATLDLRKLMGRRARLIGTVLRARPLEQKAAAIAAFAREVVPHLRTGAIVPVVDAVFPAAEAAAAFDRLAASGKLGKVLLDFGDDADS